MLFEHIYIFKSNDKENYCLNFSFFQSYDWLQAI